MRHLFTVFLTMVCCIAAVAETYTILGNTVTVTNSKKVDNIYYDCYTSDGNNYAIAYNYGKLTLPTELNISSTVTYLEQEYTVIGIADGAFDDIQYDDYIIAASIPNTVRTIGNEAFCGNRHMSKVTIGSGVKTIGTAAFSECRSLAYLEMGANVEIIGERAFESCSKLRHLELPASVVSIGRAAFAGDNGLKSIEWDLSAKKFSYDDFYKNMVFLGLPRSVLIHTKTVEQAELARKFFDYVYCDEEVENNAKNEKAYNLCASLYLTYMNENKLTTTHYNSSHNGDVNEDGKVNAADVVSIYNRIINGNINSYEGHEYVDMGLSSGTLWATCNLGASVPEEVGDYFAWGEKTWSSHKFAIYWEKYGFTPETYITQSDDIDNMTSGSLTHYQTPMGGFYLDWGGKWNMPTSDQASELCSMCTISDVEINGVKCLELVSDINGNKLYFPKGGLIDGYLPSDTESAYYWSGTTTGKTTANIIPFKGIAWHYRYLGMPIRPVVLKSDIDK